MATNKETVVLIIDVGFGAEELTKNAADCCIELMKKKMFNYPKDLICILLLRTKGTANLVSKDEPKKYRHLTQVLPDSQPASWSMIKQFKNALQRPKSKNGDWVEALNLAVSIISEDIVLHKSTHGKIVLFSDFDYQAHTLDDEFIDRLNELYFMVVIVSNNIQFVNNEIEPFPKFRDYEGKSEDQLINENEILRLSADFPNGTYCTFHDATRVLQHKELKRPWAWNATLTLGSTVTIFISGLIRIKEELNVPKFQKKFKSRFDLIRREKRYFSGVEELVSSDCENLITGYMLGDTPIQFDFTLGSDLKDNARKGIHLIGFVSNYSIPQEHFSGHSTYFIIPQQGKHVSAKTLYALIKSMTYQDLNMLAWKVFNTGQTAKLVLLIPSTDIQVPSLAMIELSYHSQHRFWEFPKLDIPKNQPTKEQLDAIDQLMDDMDIGEDLAGKVPLDRLMSKPYPIDFIPNIRHQLLIDYLENVVLNGSREISTRPLAIPKELEPQATISANKLKLVFPLEKRQQTAKEKLREQLKSSIRIDPNTPSTSRAALQEEIRINYVGTVTPAEDFTTLIEQIVNRMPIGPDRAAKFHQYACQMRTVISDLLFKSMTEQYIKAEEALTTYRKIVQSLNSQEDYNDWIKDIRLKLIERKMLEFWESVIVAKKLGLCIDNDPEAEAEFYDVSREVAAATKVEVASPDEVTVEDLFENM